LLKAQPSLVLRLADEAQRCSDNSPEGSNMEHSRGSTSRREKRTVRLSRNHPYSRPDHDSKHGSPNTLGTTTRQKKFAQGDRRDQRFAGTSGSKASSSTSASMDRTRIKRLESSILQRLSKGEKPVLPRVSWTT